MTVATTATTLLTRRQLQPEACPPAPVLWDAGGESRESRPRRGRLPCQAHRKRNTQTDGLLSSPKTWAVHMVQRN